MIRLRIILTLITFLTLSNVKGQIPTIIKQTSDSIILSRLGTKYSKLTKYDCENSRLYYKGYPIPDGCDKEEQRITKKKLNERKIDYYVLAYRLTFQPFCHFDFEVHLDNKRKLNDKLNLPDCVNTSACEIKVDSLSAVDLAIKSGLEKGLGIYNTGLIFDNETQTFQWEIKNHISIDLNKGYVIYIDAQTGQRIRTKDLQWSRYLIH